MGHQRDSKIKKPTIIITSLIEQNSIRYAEHAVQRMFQRDITTTDIKFILTKGWHVPSRDRWTDKDGWSYCFEGLTDEKRRLRVAVAIKKNLIVVTVVSL